MHPFHVKVLTRVHFVTTVFPAVTEDSIGRHHVAIVIAVLAAVIMLLMFAIFIITLRHRRRKQAASHGILKPVAHSTNNHRITVNMKGLELQYQPKYALNGNVYGQVNLDDPDKLVYQEPDDFKASVYPATYSNG